MQEVYPLLEKIVNTETYDPSESKGCKKCFEIGLERIIGNDPITGRQISCAKPCDCEKGNKYRIAYAKATSKKSI